MRAINTILLGASLAVYGGLATAVGAFPDRTVPGGDKRVIYMNDSLNEAKCVTIQAASCGPTSAEIKLRGGFAVPALDGALPDAVFRAYSYTVEPGARLVMDCEDCAGLGDCTYSFSVTPAVPSSSEPAP